MPEISRNRQNARYAEDVVNVKDFGAVGDGVTDDTAAIQAAIDYAESIKGTVTIPESIYAFTNLSIDSASVCVTGEGSGSELLSTATTGAAITVSSDVVRLEAFKLTASTGRQSGSGDGILLSDGIFSVTKFRNSLKNIQIVDQPGNGVYARAQELLQCEDLNIARSGIYGFFSDDGGVGRGINNTFINVRCFGSGDINIYEDGQINSLYLNCECLQGGGTQEMRIGGSSTNATIINADIEGDGTATRGLQLGGSYHQVLGGYINNIVTDGILLASATHCRIENPRIRSATTTTNGIRINDSSCSGNKVRLTNSSNVTNPLVNFNNTGTFNEFDDGTTKSMTRLASAQSTDLVAGDFSLSGGWGDSASVSSVDAKDNRGKFTVTSTGTGQSANPTIILTFTDGAFPSGKPFFSIVRNGGDQLGVDFDWTQTSSALTITWRGTPVDTQTYTFEYVSLG